MANCEIKTGEQHNGKNIESRRFQTGNIYLIGGRWGGKTAIGRPLAVGLRKDFVDLDDLAEEKLGTSIDNFFRIHNNNWDPFRDEESQILREASQLRNTVFATGGGVVERPENIEIMQQTGIIVYLKASPETLQQRALRELREQRVRRRKPPLLPGSQSAIDEIPRVLSERGPVYEQTADITIDTDFIDEATDVQRIITELSLLNPAH